MTATCEVIFELANTDPAALIEFLRAQPVGRRSIMADTYTDWLLEQHGIHREAGFIARNWAVLTEYMPWEPHSTTQHSALSGRDDTYSGERQQSTCVVADG